MKRQSTEDFQGSKTTLHETTMVDTGHYTLVHTHGTYTTETDPGVDCGL